MFHDMDEFIFFQFWAHGPRLDGIRGAVERIRGRGNSGRGTAWGSGPLDVSYLLLLGLRTRRPRLMFLRRLLRSLRG